MSIDFDNAHRRWIYGDMECAIDDSGIGFFNGYVRIPPGHFAHGMGYDQLNRAVSIHGGLTYGSDVNGWVGFDTGHSGDYWPGLTHQHRLYGAPERTWDMQRLTAEVTSLADQLAALTSIPDPEYQWDCTDDEFRVLLRQAKAWRRLRGMSEARP